MKIMPIFIIIACYWSTSCFAMITKVHAAHQREIAYTKAMEVNDFTTVIKLIKEGLDPDNIVNPWGHPLHIAASNGNLELLKLLLEKEDKVDRRADTLPGETPLHYAIYGNQTATVQFLLEKGADITLRPNYPKDSSHDTESYALVFARKTQAKPEIIALLEKYEQTLKNK
jgi:ankyrin repeat protein